MWPHCHKVRRFALLAAKPGGVYTDLEIVMLEVQKSIYTCRGAQHIVNFAALLAKPVSQQSAPASQQRAQTLQFCILQMYNLYKLLQHVYSLHLVEISPVEYFSTRIINMILCKRCSIWYNIFIIYTFPQAYSIKKNPKNSINNTIVINILIQSLYFMMQLWSNLKLFGTNALNRYRV